MQQCSRRYKLTAYPQHRQLKLLTVWQLEVNLAKIFRFLHDRHAFVDAQNVCNEHANLLISLLRATFGGVTAVRCLKCQVSTQVDMC